MKKSDPIAIYNIDKKELVAVFEIMSEATKYLFPLMCSGKRICKLLNAIQYKTRLEDTIFEFKVAVRYANSEQRALLKKDEWYIVSGYPARFSTSKRIIVKARPEKQPKNLKVHTQTKNIYGT